ncbi:hypothetical protein BZG36_03600 [Bifiguratus adelaidae]|uniref:Uncharacterized protein n=1 Tax=Bifiguratus adelaidae TaxID=1938954 RepID=A0A261XYG4_9FUNG|nr:hypothetical protein BZG36_03600 [Bifiguratus adelaidae]
MRTRLELAKFKAVNGLQDSDFDSLEARYAREQVRWSGKGALKREHSSSDGNSSLHDDSLFNGMASAPAWLNPTQIRRTPATPSIQSRSRHQPPATASGTFPHNARMPQSPSAAHLDDHRAKKRGRKPKTQEGVSMRVSPSSSTLRQSPASSSDSRERTPASSSRPLFWMDANTTDEVKQGQKRAVSPSGKATKQMERVQQTPTYDDQDAANLLVLLHNSPSVDFASKSKGSDSRHKEKSGERRTFQSVTSQSDSPVLAPIKKIQAKNEKIHELSMPENAVAPHDSPGQKENAPLGAQESVHSKSAIPVSNLLEKENAGEPIKLMELDMPEQTHIV